MKKITDGVLDFGFYNMDCMEGMKHFPDKYFDLAIVDPPYGDGGGQWKRQDKSRFGGVFDRYRKNGIPRESVSEWAEHGRASSEKIITWDVAPKQEYFEELFRISQNQIIWGGNYFDLPPTRCFLIWHKINVPEKFTMAMAEYAWTSFNDNAKWFDFSAIGQPNRFHPTQKPVELYEWILKNYAKPDDIILDTHVGSGSSLIACQKHNFRYIGFEIDPDYYSLASDRISRETAQITLWNMEGGDQDDND